MADLSREAQIFRAGSRTYYVSSLFFPAAVRADVFRLYSFVRVVDDYVDISPRNIATFTAVKKAWRAQNPARLTDTTARLVMQNMLDVAQKYNFDPAWVDAFLWSMAQDASNKPVEYRTLHDSLRYVYGSAEVIGLMMTSILLGGADKGALHAAQLQGRAMQWINFCRDIEEDNRLPRCYFPREDFEQFDLADLSSAEASRKPRQFAAFVRHQVARYELWQQEASAGWACLPRRSRVPVIAASNMYGWTARQLRRNPHVVFCQQLKPSKPRILLAVTRASIAGR